MTETQRRELSILLDNCIANFKEMHDWVLSTATYSLVDGKRVPITPTPLESAVTYGETTYTEDNEEYRLAKFSHEFTQHFNMHYCCLYYVFTFFALMTDQRAKNLFLTRWKDEDGVYRWYPYFYDNDTIFGINNEGALVFDYYHEDTDQLGSSNVYNGQNSAFWNNFRVCFSQKIQDTYKTLRSDKKLTYDALINQFVTLGSDKWSAAIYNEDAEYKYITMARQLTEDGDVDASNLYQVRGPGEHHLRYFVDNRLNYCDGKWYAGDYPDDYIFLRIYTPTTAAIDDTMSEEEKEAILQSNARIEASLSVVPADPRITVTPFSNMYAGVRYKSGNLQQQRLVAGESYRFSPINPNETFGDTETAIYGASELSSLGDLSGLYCGVISLGKASKLTNLKIGHESPLYHNDNFREISVGSNRLLKTIDLRNCSGLGIAGENPQKTLELSGCPNIEHIYTEGTNLESVDLPESGYIKTLHLPSSINTLVVKKQKNIEDFTVGANNSEDYRNIKTLCIEESQLDTDAILSNCRVDGKFTVERVRLTGINWTFDNTDFIKSLYPKFDEDGKLIGGIRGIDEKNNNLDDAYLVGSCFIKTLTGAEYTEIKSHYPYLDIKFEEMTSNVIFNYTDLEGESHSYTTSLTSKNSELGNCSAPNLDPAPAWPENDAFSYEHVGWSRKQQISKGIDDTEEDYKDYIQVDALLNIAGDRMLYPVFKAIRKSYPVTFINLTAKEDKQILQIVDTPYGKDAIYTADIPEKLDTLSTGLYEFVGWYPSPANVTEARTCYAQFAVLDSTWHELSLIDLAPESYSAGYTLDNVNKTMSITKCYNISDPAIKIPETFELGGSYQVAAVGGFADNSKLELIQLPESTREISYQGFYNCFKLLELALPQNLQRIGQQAFFGCTKLAEIYIPKNVSDIGAGALSNTRLKNIEVDPNNEKYLMVDGCLVRKDTGLLLKGLSTGLIPQDGSIKALSDYCFYETEITSVEIPSGITEVADKAFTRCYYLTSVSFPETLEVLGATCFSWCSSLQEITLPSSLREIRTYVFNECALESITIPASVNTILNYAFGGMSSLVEVTFEEKRNAQGNIVAPKITENAFAGSSSLIFNLPWNKDTKDIDGNIPVAPWGAKNCTIKYADGTVEHYA